MVQLNNVTIAHTPRCLKTAQLSNLTIAQQQFVISVINRVGTGGHPVATLQNLKYFTPGYLGRLLHKAKKLTTLSPAGQAMLASILY